MLDLFASIDGMQGFVNTRGHHGPCVAILLDWTPRFEQYIAQLGVKNGHSKDTYLR